MIPRILEALWKIRPVCIHMYEMVSYCWRKKGRERYRARERERVWELEISEEYESLWNSFGATFTSFCSSWKNWPFYLWTHCALFPLAFSWIKKFYLSSILIPVSTLLLLLLLSAPTILSFSLLSIIKMRTPFVPLLLANLSSAHYLYSTVLQSYSFLSLHSLSSRCIKKK